MVVRNPTGINRNKLAWVSALHSLLAGMELGIYSKQWSSVGKLDNILASSNSDCPSLILLVCLKSSQSIRLTYSTRSTTKFKDKPRILEIT